MSEDWTGDGLSTSKLNLFAIFSLGIILTSAGLGGGDLSYCFSPKYGHVQGGGSGYDVKLSDGSNLISSDNEERRRVVLEVAVPLVFVDSWKLDPLLLHLGDGLSSLLSPSWNVDALRRLSNHGDASVDNRRGEFESERFSSVLRSPELK